MQKNALFQDLMQAHGIVHMRGVELFRHIRSIHNLYDMVFSEHLRDDRLSGPRWAILMRLYVEEARGNATGLSPTALSRYQSVSKNTVSALLRGLEEQGLVTRTLAENDRRSFSICLTEAGRTEVRDKAPERLEFLNKLVSGLSETETVQLLGLLARLRKSLLQHANVGECYDSPVKPLSALFEQADPHRGED